MKAFFTELFEYSHQANQALITSFLTLSSAAPEHALTLINHMISAHQIWNNRLLPDTDSFEVWQQHNTEVLAELDRQNFEKSIHIVNQLGPGALSTYKTSKGVPFTNSFQDILFHVVNHSTYHRGQIALEFRRAGIEPLVSDYIFYKR